MLTPWWSHALVLQSGTRARLSTPRCMPTVHEISKIVQSLTTRKMDGKTLVAGHGHTFTERVEGAGSCRRGGKESSCPIDGTSEQLWGSARKFVERTEELTDGTRGFHGGESMREVLFFILTVIAGIRPGPWGAYEVLRWNFRVISEVVSAKRNLEVDISNASSALTSINPSPELPSQPLPFEDGYARKLAWAQHRRFGKATAWAPAQQHLPISPP